MARRESAIRCISQLNSSMRARKRTCCTSLIKAEPRRWRSRRRDPGLATAAGRLQVKAGKLRALGLRGPNAGTACRIYRRSRIRASWFVAHFTECVVCAGENTRSCCAAGRVHKACSPVQDFFVDGGWGPRQFAGRCALMSMPNSKIFWSGAAPKIQPEDAKRTVKRHSA